MSNLPREQLEPAEAIRRMVPAGTVLLAMLLMALPLPLAWGVMPQLALLLVIIWASIQPRLVPVWAAFLLGLFQDLLFGGAIGIWALLLPVAVVAVRLAEARVEGHSLGVDWAFAALLTVAILMAAWQLQRFLGAAPPLMPFLVQAMLTALAYPLVAWAAARIQLRLATR